MRVARRTSLLTLLAFGSLLVLSTSAPAAVKLHSCDLGAARPLRCGHVTVPLRRVPTWRSGRPGSPSPSARAATAAVLRWHDPRRRRRSRLCLQRSALRPLSAAALAPLLRRRDLVFVDERGTGRSGVDRLPGAAERVDPGIHRDRPVRRRPRTALRRLHDRRSRRRPRRRPRGARPRRVLLSTATPTAPCSARPMRLATRRGCAA